MSAAPSAPSGGPPLRSVAAGVLSLTGADPLARRLAGRLFGGYILALHDIPAETFCEQIEALRPDQPVHLEELVARVKRGASTRGLFAITVDDGVGDTVRALTAAAVERHWPVTFFLPTRYLDEGDAMPFQWLAAVQPYLPGLRAEIGHQSYDLEDPRTRETFLRELTARMYSRPAEEYVPVIGRLVTQVRREHPDLTPPPAPIGWAEVGTISGEPCIRFESHGVTHTAVAALGPLELAAELQASRDRIAGYTNRPCRYFCYPFGGSASIGPEAPGMVGKYYEGAVTMRRGRVGAAAPLLLPRIPLYPRDVARIARLKVLTA
jgi:peptidoglycan/xylan/chitin deacetylase (PgdA/CDA1 family)